MEADDEYGLNINESDELRKIPEPFPIPHPGFVSHLEPHVTPPPQPCYGLYSAESFAIKSAFGNSSRILCHCIHTSLNIQFFCEQNIQKLKSRSKGECEWEKWL
jgi:hypothetical protein